MIAENKLVESGTDFMLHLLHCNVVLASRRLVLSCLLLERQHLAQTRQCRPKKLIDLFKSHVVLHGCSGRFSLAFKLRGQPPPCGSELKQCQKTNTVMSSKCFSFSGFASRTSNTASSGTLCMWPLKVLKIPAFFCACWTSTRLKF